VQSENQALTYSSSSDDAPSFPASASFQTKYVTCIMCYTNGRTCDGQEPCSECVRTQSKCKRAKCRDYKAGTCKRQGCTRAHEGDEARYKKLVRAGHVTRKGNVTAKKDDDDDEDDASGSSSGRADHDGQWVQA